jgi:hypothetical protein
LFRISSMTNSFQSSPADEYRPYSLVRGLKPFLISSHSGFLVKNLVINQHKRERFQQGILPTGLSGPWS